MGYTDIKQQIVDALMNREEGTQIQPQNHQEFALALLEYIRQVELVSGSTLIGIAQRSTVPVQSDNAFECYISACPSGESITFENFHGQDGASLTFTAEGTSAYLLLLTWNKQYWEYTAIPTSVNYTEVFQSTGDSETVTMSQKAITEMLNKKPTIADGEDADLDVADDGGNVIARFKEGHIQTKEFNSKQVKEDIKSLEEQQQILLDGVGYYVCDSPASDVFKVVSGPGSAHAQGVSQKVKMTYATTTTLTSQYRFGIDGIAHPIRYNGKPADKNNSWADGEIIEIWCDGRFAYAKPWQSGTIDPTLEVEGAAADAKATGDRLKALEEKDVSQLMEWGDNPDLIIKDKQGNEIAELNDGEIKTPHFDSRKQPQINDDSEADLDIGDENGNSVVRFKDGHVQTKNFNSSQDATEEQRGLMSAQDKQKLNGIEEGAQVNETNVVEGTEGDLDISDEEGNAIARFKGGHIQTKEFDSRVNGQTAVTDGEDAELDIGDEQGNAIARFAGGEVQTKNFDSAATPKQADDNSDADLQISDEEGNAIAEFKGGHLRTKEFDSRMVPSQEGTEEADLDITDPNGNAIARFKHGHVQTQKFDSENPFAAEVIETEEGKQALKFGSFAARVVTTKSGRKVAILTNAFVEGSTLYV